MEVVADRFSESGCSPDVMIAVLLYCADVGARVMGVGNCVMGCCCVFSFLINY